MPDSLQDCATDAEVYEFLEKRLEERIPSALQGDLDAFVAALRLLQRGLRAMAATYQLDVSMTLDDLGWHFANWHHLGLCQETAVGLRELGATEAADIFDEALSLVLPHWDQMGRLLEDDFRHFIDWYSDSELENALTPLNERMWALAERLPDFGLLYYWIAYAREHPDRLT